MSQQPSTEPGTTPAAGGAVGRGRSLIEVVPNFSEGRRRDVIDAIVAACRVSGVLLLNTQWDPDHNRLDCTLIGDADAVRRSALAGAAKAAELIDMAQHRGSHPRMGAVDVIPFVPVRNVTMDECVELARDVGREIAETVGLPVYLYDRAATSPGRQSLADVRRGEYEGLKADVAAGRRLPDFGPHEIGKAGAVAVGARKPLIAFNVYFRGQDEDAVKAVARAVRESTGGLRNVRAIGFGVPERGLVEVSMNLVDHEATPVHRALELVRREAERHGLAVAFTEIVGLVPQAAVADSSAFYLQLDGFDPERQILENLVTRADAETTEARVPPAVVPEAPPGTRGQRVGEFLDLLASPEPTPGGGTTAAVAGAAGAALVSMVARLTRGKKGYEEHDARMQVIALESDRAREEFLDLGDRDAEAFDAVMAAYRRPKDTDEQMAARREAVQRALAGAADVPLRVARLATSELDMAREVTEVGNVNAASDGAAGAQLLAASANAALANVEINAASIKDAALANRLRGEAEQLRRRVGEVLEAVQAAFRGRA
jgi:glutamate formiminotransferase / formiminotetrahydrofolate cyclodeaminase